MLTFHKEEIEQAALKPDEDEALAQRKAYFDHAGKIVLTRAGVWRSRVTMKLRVRGELLDWASAIESLRGSVDAFDGMG